MFQGVSGAAQLQPLTRTCKIGDQQHAPLPQIFTLSHLESSSSPEDLRSSSCNSPHNWLAACQTCRFAARCRTSSPRRWAERWRWRRRHGTKPRRGPELRSRTAPDRRAAGETTEFGHQRKTIQTYLLLSCCIGGAQTPVWGSMDWRGQRITSCFTWWSEGSYWTYRGGCVRWGGDGSDRGHAGLVHVAVVLLLQRHSLVISSRKDRSWRQKKKRKKSKKTLLRTQKFRFVIPPVKTKWVLD